VRGRVPGAPRRAICAAGLALAACALGYACGRAATRKPTALPAAGTPRDDGRGVLARLSAGVLEGSDDSGRERSRRKPEPGTRDGRDGTRVGGATYGGARYANYRFDRSPRPHSAPLPYARRYVPLVPAEYGSIEGVVQWPRPPRAPERLRQATSSAPNPTPTCPSGTPNQTLALGSSSGVANAVVYLEDISTGRMLLGRVNSSYPNPTKHMQTGGVLEWRECRFHPQVQVIAPIGSVLSLSAADEAIEVMAVRVDGRAREHLWTVPLGARGSAHEHLLERDGFVELSAGGKGQAASGWVVVAPHPYYAVTDERGRFALDQVPPGQYTLVVWHEPVVVGFSRTGEQVTHTPPPVRRKVVVRARQGQRVNIKLQPAH
jgi:hypothetical protein